MGEDFHLMDLVSQAGAVQRFLAGKTDADKLAWLAARGKLERVPETPHSREIYRFESVFKREAIFFFDMGEFVFVGDHTTFTVSDD